MNDQIHDVVVVVEVADLSRELLQKCGQLCSDRFNTSVYFVAPKKLEMDKEFAPWPTENKSKPKAIVYLLSINQTPSHLSSAKRACSEVFKIEVGNQQRLRLRNIEGSVEYDKTDTHVFNRVSHKREKGYIYFPYGYLYRMAGHGPLDEFGFRITENLKELSSRPDNHKVIVTFGGSTTWSIDCLPSETYTKRLESLLNEDPRVLEKGERYTCINFGQVSYSVLSEMMTFILFAWDVSPDIVLAHDGWNDLLYGTYTDPYLVQERNIVYPCDLESWGQILHDGANASTTKNGSKPYPFRSAPSSVLYAYYKRKDQFRRISQAAGSAFIWGLQPCLYDKNSLALSERAFLESDNPINQDDWMYVRKRIPELMRKTAAACEGEIENFVDIGQAFGELSEEIQHFSDTIHLTPAGDEVVAVAYKNYITENL